jgi:hypothetical protein
MHHLEGARAEQLIVGADTVQHVQMAAGGHFLLVGVRQDFLIRQIGEALAMFAAMRKQQRLVDPQFGGRADVPMAIDNHEASPLLRDSAAWSVKNTISYTYLGSMVNLRNRAPHGAV